MAIDPNDSTVEVVVSKMLAELRKVSKRASSVELSDVIADVRINTTTQGASSLEIDVIDPQWVLLTSGFLDVSRDGRLRAADLNFPANSNYWWRLTQVDPSTGTGAGGGPNLTLTFEDRVVGRLRRKSGQKSWSRAKFTRAQAIKAMADEVKAPPRTRFISPELNVKQAIEVNPDERHASASSTGGTNTNEPDTGSTLTTFQLGGKPAPHAAVSKVAAAVLKEYPGLVVTSTTGGGHAVGSYHYDGKAVDLGGDAATMKAAADWINHKLRSRLAEGIHNPNLSVKHGALTSPLGPGYWTASTWADHVDHIHLAVED